MKNVKILTKGVSLKRKRDINFGKKLSLNIIYKNLIKDFCPLKKETFVEKQYIEEKMGKFLTNFMTKFLHS